MEGQISISYPRGSEEDFVEIKVRDVISTELFLTLRISYHDFTAALSTQVGCPCNFTVNGLENIGKTIEKKFIEVMVPGLYFSSIIDEKELGHMAVSEYEIDGWKCSDVSRLFNHHFVYSRGDKQYSKIMFHRFVDTK